MHAANISPHESLFREVDRIRNQIRAAALQCTRDAHVHVQTLGQWRESPEHHHRANRTPRGTSQSSHTPPSLTCERNARARPKTRTRNTDLALSNCPVKCLIHPAPREPARASVGRAAPRKALRCSPAVAKPANSLLPAALGGAGAGGALVGQLICFLVPLLARVALDVLEPTGRASQRPLNEGSREQAWSSRCARAAAASCRPPQSRASGRWRRAPCSCAP